MIRSVLIEIRPCLRTCCFCIVLKERVKEEVMIKVRKNRIILRVAENDFPINLNNVEVEPLSMTCFTVKNDTINFRIEISCCKIDTKISEKRSLPIHKEEVTKLICKCGNDISDEVIFKRVLPLPSHDLELADMFCHYDNNAKTSLIPKLNDCFYGVHYISVNCAILKNVKLNALIRCNRCLNCIGISKKDIYHLWNTCLILPHENLSPLEEFKRIVRNAIEESFVIFLKIFLECKENNKGLLLSVVDKDLIVSFAKEDLCMISRNVFKLKYQYYSSLNSNIRKFLMSNDVQCIHVPQLILVQGLEYLMKSTEEIPSPFNQVDEELMAYLERLN